ncbi:MAG: VIT1/CCC1 transporter family protein [Anaerolineales bacterium]|nr:VIT1/CCC1 transporter family protein [Anaerolineales bacterium]MCX7607947.1 VIT1/CCC1 transporter family protein [Anaerolineales bacterium]MDW8227883.1 VIT1/CCC1 transporter family protein [Anaerolineales bacterium]
MTLDANVLNRLLIFQRLELTEHFIYSRIAKSIKDDQNRQILEKIAADELHHARMWQEYTGQEVKPNRLAIWFYTLVSRLFGFTFAVKLMELGEEKAQGNYSELQNVIPEIERWIQDEDAHEQALLGMLDEERLRYAGSVVLGLNDALVELTGALAGLTLALQNTRLIALSGLITGIAASLSMAASEYLSTRSEDTQKQPVRAAVYTGIAYILTVALLILPYLLFSNYYLDLAISLTTAVLIIAVFNYYISVAREEPFRKRFVEMAGLSLSVAAFSFGIGYLIRLWLGVDI